ncbi:MAG: TIGR02099 family protein [Gammaproteobacteria bacterium]|nr:TIGR02099 family protein [Gammaproteobacteria bacterium]
MISTSTPTVQSHTRRANPWVVRGARTMLRYILLFVAILLILLALLTVAARIGLPYIANYKPDIEAGLSEKLQNPVEIGTLDLRWREFGPELRASDVRVIESDDRQVTFDELLIDLNFAKSMMARLPVISELSLVGAELVVEQGSDGSLRLHGVDVNGQAADTVSAPGIDVLSWLLKAEKVGLLDANVTLVNGNQQELLLQGVNIRAETDNGVHQVRLDMDLPDVLGGALAMGADVRSTDNELKSASGDFHLQAEDLNLRGLDFLKSLFTQNDSSADFLGDLDTTASVQIWGSLEQGAVQSARGQFRSGPVRNKQTGRTIIHAVESDMSFEQLDGAYSLRAPAIRLAHPSQETLLKNVQVTHQTSGDTPWQVSGSGDSLSIPMITEMMIAARDLPLLERMRPNGQLTNWTIEYSQSKNRNGIGSEPDKRSIAFSAGLQDLYAQASEFTPGVNNVSGRIAIDDNKGVVTLLGQQSTIVFPAWYEQPIQIAAFTSDLNIDLSDSEESKISGQISLVDTGLGSTARVRLSKKTGQAPHLDVQGGFELEDVALLKPLLPKKILPSSTYLWMNRALNSGRLRNGKILLFGQMDEFPFNHGEGVFKVGFDLTEAEIAAIRNWPSFQDVAARVDIGGLHLSIDVDKAVLAGVGITQASINVDDLSDPWLSVDGTADGTVQKLLQFANNGPLKRVLRPALVDASGTGRAQMDLTVDMPLRRQNKRPIVQDMKVKGSVFLRNNTVAFARSNLTLDNVVGAVGFTGQGIRIRNLKASTLGAEVQLDGDTVIDSSGQRVTKLALRGALSAKDVMQHYQLPLDRFIHGPAQWTVQLQVPHSSKSRADGLRLLATSDLVGSSLVLPAPLGKTNSSSVGVSIETQLVAGDRDQQWLVEYGDALSSRIVVRNKKLYSLTMRFGGGVIHEPVAAGVRVDGAASRVSLDGWVNTVKTLVADLPKGSTRQPLLLVSANLRTNQLMIGSNDLGSAQLQANSDDTYLNAVIRNQSLSGNVRYPRRYWKKDIKALARLDRFEKQVVSGLPSESPVSDTFLIDPRLLPPLDIRVANLLWEQWDVKDLVIRTRPQVGGLSIDALGFANETSQLIGEGYWRLRDPQNVNPTLAGKHLTQVNLTLQSGDLGETMERLGMTGVMNEGEGTASASLQWPGPLYAPRLAQLNGNFELDLQRGRLLQLEPGAARLMGLFALQTLPRRISFDFKDITQDGLDYDSIKGEVELANGVANTRLIQLNGAVGVIDITGELNILTQQYNQEITVLPRVSAALPIIGAISGGASGGVGALLAGGFLKAIGVDFDRIGLMQYTLTGSWDNPSIKPITPESLSQ